MPIYILLKHHFVSILIKFKKNGSFVTILRKILKKRNKKDKDMLKVKKHVIEANF